MKHTLTLRPLLLALLLACLPQWAKAYDSYDFTVDGIYYTITSSTDQTVAVQYSTSTSTSTRKNKYSGDVVIPSTVTYNETTYTVTSISAYEFYQSTGLTSITIPSSVDSIGRYAFYGCTGLTSLTLPESIVSIESYAFRGCTGLTSLTLNEGLTSIESYVFYGCTGLTSLTLPESMVGIGDYAFYNCTGLTSLTLNEGLTVIGSYAFRGCTGLTSLTIPSTVETIYEYAFGISSSSTALTSVTILGPTYSAAYAFQYQQGLTSITVNVGATFDSYAFRYCSKLTSLTVTGEGAVPAKAYTGFSYLTTVTLSSGITAIGDSAFCNLSTLTSATVPSTVTEIGDYAFYKTSLTSVKIASGVERIGAYAYAQNSNLTTLSIGSKVSVIGEGAFYNCYNLTTAVISASVDTIGDYAFYQCEDLSSLTINSGVKSIGDYAFSKCYSLTGVTLPASVTELGRCVFENCTSLQSITVDSENTVYASSDGVLYDKAATTLIYCPIGKSGSLTVPSSVTVIEDNACLGCTALTSVELPDGLLTVGDSAFYGCTKLTSATLPSSVESVGHSAFYNCYKLAGAVELNNLAYLGPYAFYYCQKLTSATLSGTLTSIGDRAFYYGTALTSVSIGESVTSIGNYAFYRSNALASLTLSEGLESIGDYAFYAYGANKVTRIDIPTTLTTIGDYAFYCSSSSSSVLADVYSLAETPATCASSNVFCANVYSDATLHVPYESFDAYYEATVWGDFFSIMADAYRETDSINYARLTAELDSLEDYMDAASDSIATYFADVAANYADTEAAIYAAIEAIGDTIEWAHEKYSLRDTTTISTATVYADIDTLLSDAAEAQRLYDNAAAYTRLSAEVDSLESYFDETIDSLEVSCADVIGQYEEQISAIEASIDSVRAVVQALYEAEQLTKESALDSLGITEQVDALAAEIVFAQSTIENTLAYARLSASLDSLQAYMDATKDSIEASCVDVLDSLQTSIDTVQATIDAAAAEVEEQYAAYALTAESSIDSVALYTAVDNLLAEALAAEKAYINEQAYTALAAQIAAQQAYLQAATDSISTACDDVAADFVESIATIQAVIDSVAADVQTRYEAVELTAESSIDTLTVYAAVDTLLAEAMAAQVAYDNAEAYARLTAQLTAAQTALDVAKDSVRTACADVAEQFEAGFSEVQTTIDSLSADVLAQYEAVALTTGSTVDTLAIYTAIDALVEEAMVAETAYVNGVVYAALTEQIAALQAVLDAATDSINNSCADVAANYADALAALQAAIDSLSADVLAQYEAVALTAESSIDTATTQAAIGALVEEAVVAEAVYVNGVVYAALTEQIAALQAVLDSATDSINNSCADVVAADYTDALAALQADIDALSADVLAQYEAVALTAESSIDTLTVYAALDTLLAEAMAAQEEYVASGKANDAYYAALCEDIDALQAYFDAAVDTIENGCANVATSYASLIDNIQAEIDAVQAEIDTLYALWLLTDETAIDDQAIIAEIDLLLYSATSAQTAYDEAISTYEGSAYDEMNSILEELQEYLNDGSNAVYTDIDSLVGVVNALYATMELNDEVTAEIEALMAQIEALLEEARSAQADYDEAVAANEAAYAELIAAIDALQDYLDLATDTINTYCPNAAADYADDLADIQTQIDSLRAQVTALYEAGSLTSESTVDTEEVAEAIARVIAAAFAAEEQATGVTGVEAPTDDECTYYSLSGQRIPAPVKGQTCIIRFSDGTSMKVLVK